MPLCSKMNIYDASFKCNCNVDNQRPKEKDFIGNQTHVEIIKSFVQICMCYTASYRYCTIYYIDKPCFTKAFIAHN